MIKSRQPFSTISDKIAWLLKHPELLLADPCREDRIVRAMKVDGLVSNKTYWPDVKLKEAIKSARLKWWSTHRR